jgi:hypothetical protein
LTGAIDKYVCSLDVPMQKLLVVQRCQGIDDAEELLDHRNGLASELFSRGLESAARMKLHYVPLGIGSGIGIEDSNKVGMHNCFHRESFAGKACIRLLRNLDDGDRIGASDQVLLEQEQVSLSMELSTRVAGLALKAFLERAQEVPTNAPVDHATATFTELRFNHKPASIVESLL